jgi:hypothetical protein
MRCLGGSQSEALKMHMRMRIRDGIVQFLSIFALIALAGCGSSSNQPVPPPGGTFSNSNLNGTYVVSFSGYDISNGYGSYFSVLGSVTANGSGGFTGGVIDIDDPALGAALRTSNTFSHLATSGTYNVTSDGRGTGSISVPINGANLQFGLDFVLTSNAHGSSSRFDSYGSGSGSIDLQGTNLVQSNLAGSHAFGFNGVDSTIVNSLATVGAFTLDAGGQITASGLPTCAYADVADDRTFRIHPPTAKPSHTLVAAHTIAIPKPFASIRGCPL